MCERDTHTRDRETEETGTQADKSRKLFAPKYRSLEARGIRFRGADVVVLEVNQAPSSTFFPAEPSSAQVYDSI